MSFVARFTLRTACLVAATLASLLFAGCTNTYTLQPYDASEAEMVRNGPPIKVSSGGKALGVLSDRPLSFSDQGLPKSAQGYPILDLEVSTPCGSYTDPTIEVRHHDKLFGTDPDMRVSLHFFRPLTVAYDNRGGEATTLKIGQLAFPVAANAAGVLHLTSAHCSGEAEVRTGETVIGKVALEPRFPSDPDVQSQILDLTGGHCYTEQTVSYGLGDSNSPSPLRGERVYSVAPEELFFLQHPADSVEITQRRINGQLVGAPGVSREYVWDEACS
jgi:hypothetical protein